MLPSVQRRISPDMLRTQHAALSPMEDLCLPGDGTTELPSFPNGPKLRETDPKNPESSLYMFRSTPSTPGWMGGICPGLETRTLTLK